VDYGAPGPHPVARWTAAVAWGDRSLPVELWAPATQTTVAQGMAQLGVDEGQRSTLQALLDKAPAGCPTQQTSSGAGLVAPGPWPLVLMSHCHGCTRASTLTIAAHLASLGMVVAAPDHVGNTLFDELAGTGLPLSIDTLDLREADLVAVRDAAVAGELDVDVDPGAVAVVGHSFGAVTAGKLLQDHLGTVGGPVAGVFIGAPVDNPLLPGVDATTLAAPTLFILLEEDHSIGVAGNVLLEGNYQAVPGPSWLVSLADAGHWSVSDLVGLTDGFMAGCGDDLRQDGGQPFSYADPATSRANTAAIVAAFLSDALGVDPQAADWLSSTTLEGVTVE